MPDIRATLQRPGRLSRRALLSGAAAATLGTALRARAPFAQPAGADDGGAQPRPLPGGVRGLHFYPPGSGMVVSTIDDFDGVVGVADLLGSGTATLADGSTETLVYRVDNRFMLGDYIGVDGMRRTGAFAEL